MGDGTTLTVQDGPAVTGYYNYDAASINGDGFTFSGTTTFGTGVNLTTQYGKNIKPTGVLTAVSGFSISGADSEYTYYTLAGTENQIGGTIAITRNSTSLGINASGSLGTAAVTTSSGNQYLTYYGTAGEAADVIDNSITGAGNFVAQSGWVHLSENVALTGTYTVNSGAVLSKAGDINAVLAGGQAGCGRRNHERDWADGERNYLRLRRDHEFPERRHGGGNDGHSRQRHGDDYGRCHRGRRPPVLHLHGQRGYRTSERDADFRPD